MGARKDGVLIRQTAVVVAMVFMVASCSESPERAVAGRALPTSVGPPPVVDAHDGSLVQDGSTFWLFGTAYECGFALAQVGTRWCGVRAFSSTDLLTWSPEGYAIAPTEVWQGRCAPPRFGCFRPHVARSPATGQWVLWVNAFDSPVGYHVLVAPSPRGPWVEAPAPTLAAGGREVFTRGDHDVFVDSSGRGWIAYTLIEGDRPADIAIERLNPELTSGTGEVVRVALGFVEAPSLFEREGRFFLAFSDPACPYCSATGTGLAWSASPLGPWTTGRPISLRSCDGQPAEVSRLRLADEAVWLYVTDRWDGGNPNQARARLWWVPLTFAPDGMPGRARCGPVPAP